MLSHVKRRFKPKTFYLAGFLLHFFLLLTVSCQQTFWLLANHCTSLPSSLENYWRKAEAVTGLALGRGFGLVNPLRQTRVLTFKARASRGCYGFFAPGVPNSYKLVFELHYDDGRVEYDLPHVKDVATGLRLSSLLDQIGRTPLRTVATADGQDASLRHLAGASGRNQRSRGVRLRGDAEHGRIIRRQTGNIQFSLRVKISVFADNEYPKAGALNRCRRS